jgi:polyisoprenoid-binding protein YceI
MRLGSLRFWRGALACAALSMAPMGASLAQPAPAEAPAAAPPSGEYRVEPEHTEIVFGINHMGFSTYYGVFTHASGRLVLDSSDPGASHLEVSVPISGVLTPSAKLNEELQGAQWFNAKAFPEMTFRSNKITRTGSGTARIEGELTLHGVTRPLTLEATFNHGGENPLNHHFTIGFQAHGHIKRSDFGVSTYVPLVGDEVSLVISAAFERAPAGG